MGLVIFGVILLLVGGGLFWGMKRAQERLYQLRTTEKYDIGDLVELQQDTAMALDGHGSLNQEAEVVGTIECDAPLTSPLDSQPCVYFSMSVEQRFEEEVWDKDKGENRMEQRSETLQSRSEGTVFRLRDDTGAMSLDPEGARWEHGLKTTVDKFEAAQAIGQISFGSFSLTVPSMQKGRRLLGYQYHETIMPLGVKVTAIGEVVDPMGEAMMRKSKAKGLTISTKSKEEIVEAAKKTVSNFRLGAIICAALGVVLAVIGAITA